MSSPELRSKKREVNCGKLYHFVKLRTDAFFLVHSYCSRGEKNVKSYQFYLGLVRQRIEFWFPFSLWKIENSPSGIQGKLMSCTEYRVITKNKKGCKFHLSLNLHECSAEFELGNVSAGGFFYLVAHKGGALASAALWILSQLTFITAYQPSFDTFYSQNMAVWTVVKETV